MTDDRFLRAAGLLYQRVEVATPGDWRDGSVAYGEVVSDALSHDEGHHDRIVGESMLPGNREYVVTVQPAVGRALANLLAYAGGDYVPTGETWRLLDAVADALLDASRDGMPGDPHAHVEEAQSG